MTSKINNILPSRLLRISNASPTKSIIAKHPTSPTSYSGVYVTQICLLLTTQMSLRVTPCIFLGNPNNHRGYICLDLSQNTIILSYVFSPFYIYVDNVIQGQKAFHLKTNSHVASQKRHIPGCRNPSASTRINQRGKDSPGISCSDIHKTSNSSSSGYLNEVICRLHTTITIQNTKGYTG